MKMRSILYKNGEIVIITREREREIVTLTRGRETGIEREELDAVRARNLVAEKNI